MRSDYTLIFSADGMISKRVAINGSSTPRRVGRWIHVRLDMSLFDAIRVLTQTSRTPPLA